MFVDVLTVRAAPGLLRNTFSTVLNASTLDKIDPQAGTVRPSTGVVKSEFDKEISTSTFSTKNTIAPQLGQSCHYV